MAYNIIQPKDLRFTLIVDDEETVLNTSPDGWTNHEFSNKRDLEYWGVLKTYATEVEFIKEAAHIIRNEVYTKGTDAEIKLKIELLNQSTWQYKTVYFGDLDLSTLEDELTRVTVNLIDGGLTAAIQARKSVNYELPFTPEDPKIQLGAVDVPSFTTLNFFGDTGSTPAADIISMRPRVGISESSQIRRTLKIKEYEATNLTSYVNDARVFNMLRDQWIIRNDEQTVSAQISGYFSLDLFYLSEEMKQLGFSAAIIGMNYLTEEMTEPVELFYTNENTSETPPPFVSVDRLDFSVNMTFKVDHIYTIILYGIKQKTPLISTITELRNNGRIRVRDASMNIKWSTPMQSGHVIKAKHLKTVFSELVTNINEKNTAVVSDLLDQNNNILVTSGDAIRAYEDAVIKTNFNDFFNSVDSIFCAGLSIDDQTPIIENKSFFFDRFNSVFDFDEVTNIKITPFTKAMFSAIKTGYEKQDYEIEEGKNEVNQTQEYTTAQKRAQNTLNIVSPYRADQYGIDTVRINEINKQANANNTDAKPDNDIFLIYCKPELNTNGNYVPLEAKDVFFVELNGSTIINKSQYFNFLLSPKTNLLKHADFIKSGLFGNNVGELVFQSAIKNKDQRYILSETAEAIQEDANIDLIEDANRLFYPFLVEFETAIKPSLQDLLDNGNKGVFTFVHNGRTFDGFLYSIDVNVHKGEKSIVTLILSPNNNINDLIN